MYTVGQWARIEDYRDQLQAQLDRLDAFEADNPVREDVPLAVELRGGGSVVRLSQVGQAAASGVAVVVGV